MGCCVRLCGDGAAGCRGMRGVRVARGSGLQRTVSTPRRKKQLQQLEKRLSGCQVGGVTCCELLRGGPAAGL